MKRLLSTALGGGVAAVLLAIGLYATGMPPAAAPAEAAIPLPAPATDAREGNQAVAVFAGGCFWGVEGVFEHVRGVRGVTAGYAGGQAGNANYDAVSGGGTNHAEAVRIVYDPRQISYGRLLQILFSVAHDPTQLNRQGPDTGRQYRSAIFPQNDAQRGVAAAYIAQLTSAKAFPRPIVTKIETGRLPSPAFGTVIGLSDALGMPLEVLAEVWRPARAAAS